jgi:hypothetical protein
MFSEKTKKEQLYEKNSKYFMNSTAFKGMSIKKI